MGMIPDDFQLNESSDYMKLEKGENRFRVLDEGVSGMEWWVKKDGKSKPIRKAFSERISPSELDADSKPKAFIAFPVWNYKTENVEILEITQKNIMRALQSYEADPDWGDLSGYDIKVLKEGDGFDTTYQVNPTPAKPMAKEVVEAFAAKTINLEALFTGENPFADA